MIINNIPKDEPGKKITFLVFGHELVSKQAMDGKRKFPVFGFKWERTRYDDGRFSKGWTLTRNEKHPFWNNVNAISPDSHEEWSSNQIWDLLELYFKDFPVILAQLKRKRSFKGIMKQGETWTWDISILMESTSIRFDFSKAVINMYIMKDGHMAMWLTGPIKKGFVIEAITLGYSGDEPSDGEKDRFQEDFRRLLLLDELELKWEKLN